MTTRLIILPGTLCDQRLFAAVTRRLRPDVCVHVARWRELLRNPQPFWWSGPEPYNLMGFSLGGIWALQRLGAASEGSSVARAQRLALLGSNAEPATVRNTHRGRQQKRVLKRQGTAAVARAAKASYFARRPKPWQARLVVQMARSTSRGVARRQFDLASERSDGLAAFQQFEGPVAVLSGVRDRLCPPPLQQRLQQARQDAQVHAIKHCGHMIPLEAPGRLAIAIRRWLAQPAHAQASSSAHASLSGASTR